MNDLEYRKLAFFIFPMLEHLLSNLSSHLQELDNRTYDSRIVREEVKKGKKTVTKISVMPLSQEQIKYHLESIGYIPTLHITLSLLDSLVHNAWNLEQVMTLINKEPSDLREQIWQPYRFEGCNFDIHKDCSVTSRLESCTWTLNHCKQFMSGDGNMDKVNAIFGYVAMQVKKKLECILYAKENKI
jgi:hypothetical protein